VSIKKNLVSAQRPQGFLDFNTEGVKKDEKKYFFSKSSSECRRLVVFIAV
jgi:hypothetical protein